MYERGPHYVDFNGDFYAKKNIFEKIYIILFQRHKYLAFQWTSEVPMQS
jgi:hypothetical protein